MNWKRSAIAAAAGVPLIALLAYGLTRDPKVIPSPLPGRDAPDFALRVFAPGDTATPASETTASALADTISLAALRGEVVVLNFWASWCAGCGVEHQALVSVAQRYEGQGVRFVGVLYNDTPELAMRWIRRMGGQNYPSLEDDGARTAIDYGLYGVPETFIIGPDGRVAYKHAGPVTEQLLIEKIEELRAGRTVPAPGS
ncbi:MAG TPA: redoxin domain-containing protein [Gemmatimonadaceae bacterium]|nr:redoxin domain-containing protein [Gemmatimonadaceae bacterium]